MKKLISILIVFMMLFITAGCSCGLSCCGSGQKLPEKKGDVNLAYDDPSTATILAYFQANQGYVVNGTLLNAETDYEALSKTVFFAVVKDAAVIEKLTAAGWKETAHWTEAQKANNEKLFGYTVLEAPNALATDAIKALTGWLGGDANSEAAELFKKFGK